MEILRWDKRFSVGNQEIDLQHKMLFNFVNYLITGSGKSYKHNEIEEILDELIAYTDYHFKSEEELLKNHPAIDNHRKIHAEFIERVLHFEAEFKKGAESINGEIFSFLVYWIRDHILETDVVYFNTMGHDKQ